MDNEVYAMEADYNPDATMEGDPVPRFDTPEEVRMHVVYPLYAGVLTDYGFFLTDCDPGDER